MSDLVELQSQIGDLVSEAYDAGYRKGRDETLQVVRGVLDSKKPKTSKKPVRKSVKKQMKPIRERTFLRALKKLGPRNVAPGDVHEALGIDRFQTWSLVQRSLERKNIAVTGQRRGTRYHLTANGEKALR